MLMSDAGSSGGLFSEEPETGPASAAGPNPDEMLSCGAGLRWAEGRRAT